MTGLVNGPVRSIPGIYSISVRDLDFSALLAWAERAGIPFVHLRGGPRGFHVVRQDERTLRAWGRLSTSTVPVTGITADTDLADLLSRDDALREAAAEEVAALVEAATILGARWVRVLAATPPEPGSQALPDLAEAAVPPSPVPLLIELHHHGWLNPEVFAVLDQFLQRHPRIRVLADTAQLAAVGGQEKTPLLARLAELTRVMHLSDTGDGLDSLGHRRLAGLVADRIACGEPIEVAVEWTGADRSPETALDRYRAATAWWSRICAGATR